MTEARPVIRQVRSELAARIGVIGAHVAGSRVADLTVEIDQIRQIAQHNGLFPAVAVAQALRSALARGERGPLIHGWLSVLNDAVGCERYDLAACETFTAACSVRLSS